MNYAPGEIKSWTLPLHLLWIANTSSGLTNEERMALRDAAEFIEAAQIAAAIARAEGK